MSPSASAAAVTAAEVTLLETERVARRFRVNPGVPPANQQRLRCGKELALAE